MIHHCALRWYFAVPVQSALSLLALRGVAPAVTLCFLSATFSELCGHSWLRSLRFLSAVQSVPNLLGFLYRNCSANLPGAGFSGPLLVL